MAGKVLKKTNRNMGFAPILPSRHKAKENTMGLRTIVMLGDKYSAPYEPADYEIMPEYTGNAMFDYVTEYDEEDEKDEKESFFEWLESFGQKVDRENSSFVFSRENFFSHLFGNIKDTPRDEIIEKVLKIMDAENYEFPVVHPGWGFHLSFADHALNNLKDGETYSIGRLYGGHI